MQEINITEMINSLAENAKKALEEYRVLNQEDVDKIVKAMAFAAMENHAKLAKMAYEETSRGVLEDKIIKNMFAAEYIWNSIKNEKTVGVIEDNAYQGYIKIADPLGVIAGVTPVTNPTSTTIFKALICAKTRNPIIFGFHPGAQKCCVKTAQILRDAAIKAGAPENSIQWIEHPSIEATSALMNHKDVDVVLATGGSGMVKSAYSTGKPALGVGPGNVPCYIEKSANLKNTKERSPSLFFDINYSFLLSLIKSFTLLNVASTAFSTKTNLSQSHLKPAFLACILFLNLYID